MGKFVIAVYRPHVGKEKELLEVVKEHVPILRGQGFVTDRPPAVMRGKDGTIVEVFEWKSLEAVEEAHRNEAVLEMWGRFNEACECQSLSTLDESSDQFAMFDPVEI
ncbi:MAG: hypothetical protein ACYS15_12870 [Planctomycetota bacterium]